MYPALAVLQALGNNTDSVLWVGSQSGLEEALLSPFNVRYASIPGGGVHGIEIFKLPGNIAELIKGFYAARSLVQQFKPDVIFYTGGYIGVPMSIAGRYIPAVVFVPDIEPGLALKVILRRADQIAVSTSRTIPFLKDRLKATATGYPLRQEIKKWNRADGRDFFKIKSSEKVLLVFGGSKGSQSINNALISHLEYFTQQYHVIHITGVENWMQVDAQVGKLDLSHSANYHPFPFLHAEMGAAFASADLVVCRSGASTMGELSYFGLPAILVPYPHAWKYQHQNAMYLSERGGALILEDENLEKSLRASVITLMEDSPALRDMGEKMHTLAVENAAEMIAEIIQNYRTWHPGGTHYD